MAKAVKWLILSAYFNCNKSIQPHRRGRPVVTPYSWPIFCIASPIYNKNCISAARREKRTMKNEWEKQTQL